MSITVNIYYKGENGKIVYSHTDGEYELRSHPFEPCIYIYRDEEMIKLKLRDESIDSYF